MPTGGTLTIETANIAVDDVYTQTHIGIERGSYIVLAISDTGVGMDAATRAQIFEPFFTTKAAGKGTGLGLATVHGIVTQSGGHIWVYSKPGYGTTFKIYLPQVDTGEDLTNASDSLAAPQGNATILLIEDDPLVRALAARVLRGYGYVILDADDGPAALRIATTYQGPIDLLLTDVIMPGGLDGRELATHMRAQRPAIKVLYMSGYTQGWLAQAIVDPGQTFMQKPFTPDSLARKVAEMLRA
jgi:CheY-like chemotaxis protein